MRKTIELNNAGATSEQRLAALKRAFGKDENDTRAAGLAAAAALLPTIMLDAFKRDDASEEFLNGMAYGAASYCSAIKALGQAAPVAQADAEPCAADVLSALLWLYRRLPRGYGRQDHIERPILALAARTGADVAADLAERGQPVIEKPIGAIDTFTVQPFAIVTGYRVEDDRPALACFTGNGYEFADGDVHRRVGDTLACFPAEFLTLFQLEQRLWAATATPEGADGARAAGSKASSPCSAQEGLEDSIVLAAHAAQASGEVALTFIDQFGIDRPTDVALAFVRELATYLLPVQEAVADEPPTGVSVAELAKVLNDLDFLTRWGHAGAGEVCRRAGDVIQRLLTGLSVSQLAAVAPAAN